MFRDPKLHSSPAPNVNSLSGLPTFRITSILGVLICGVLLYAFWGRDVAEAPNARTPESASLDVLTSVKPAAPFSSRDRQSRAGDLKELSYQLAGAINRINEITDPVLKERAVEVLIPTLMEQDPRMAAELICSLGFWPAVNDLLSQVIPQWAKKDFSAVLDWIMEQENGPVKQQALLHFSYEWLKVNPQEAVRFVESLPHDEGRTRLLATMASEWAESEPEAAASWALSVNEENTREKIWSSLASAWARNNPTAAADYVIESLPAGAAQTEAVISVISAWASQDPKAVGAWVARFPEGQTKDYAMENLFSAWGKKDVGSATEFLSGLPRNRSRDLAIYTFAQEIASSYPAQAFEWAQSIDDDQLRQSRLVSCADAWLQKDFQTASHHVAQSSLPQAIKNRLLSPGGGQ